MDLAIRNVKPVISTHIKNGMPVFDVRVKARGTILSQTGVQGDIDQLVNNEVRKEIMSTFMKGVDQHVDLFHLERVAYRWDNRLWKETFQKHRLSINKNMLGNVTVDVKVIHATRLRIAGS